MNMKNFVSYEIPLLLLLFDISETGALLIRFS